VQVSPEFLDKNLYGYRKRPKTELEVNLPEQAITITATGEVNASTSTAIKSTTC
jgi:3-isopropylmalate/(R)-2-methylmalate dehydratase small subunit